MQGLVDDDGLHQSSLELLTSVAPCRVRVMSGRANRFCFVSFLR